VSDAPCMPLLRERAIHFDTRLCIGIDPVRERLPEVLFNESDPMLTFCTTIVRSVEMSVPRVNSTPAWRSIPLVRTR